MGKGKRIVPGIPDDEWIPIIAAEGRLVLSRNIRMLDSTTQRELLVANKAAVIFLPPKLKKIDELRLVLKRWDWIEYVHDSQPRCFAYRLTPGGTPIPEDLLNYVPRSQRVEGSVRGQRRMAGMLDTSPWEQPPLGF